MKFFAQSNCHFVSRNLDFSSATKLLNYLTIQLYINIYNSLTTYFNTECPTSFKFYTHVAIWITKPRLCNYKLLYG